MAGSLLRKETETHMKDDKLLPASTIVALMKKQVSKLQVSGAVVALSTDSFPRSIENDHDLDRICGAPEDAIYMDVPAPDDVMMERILKEWKI